MATVFETRLIGNIGKDATVRNMERGVIAINFPVAHNKNWRDKRTGESKTKTTWVNCTIWKKEGANLRILDFLKKGALVELVGTPFPKAYLQDDNSIKTEIRLNVSKTNILRPSKDQGMPSDDDFSMEDSENDLGTGGFEDFTLNEEDF
ncbi:single stranded DNA-binding protein (ssb) [Lishizhenia tianjinensis]|uniref:Single-stranded DNA-binding protein n=1 Tax=Lishizhenia tianjinensis TaxID=477690 RepID=A0A1I7BES7_9FLAO|nr:single-stranded DNA-binding protein [Lishizhenia tianjinensis]SFT85611.1 single stranded DNA-binding protein (ssb) [Lishizhenia tianjinensis]